MWRFRKTQPKFPKSFYEKGGRLIEQARKETDPDIKQVELDAAAKYYETDANVKLREPFLGTLMALLLVYVVVVGTAMYAFHEFSFLAAAGVVIAAYAFLAFLVGAAFRASGYISEKGFMGIFRGGLQIVLFLRKPSRDPKREQ